MIIMLVKVVETSLTQMVMRCRELIFSSVIYLKQMSKVTNGFGSETSNVQGIRNQLASSSTTAGILGPGPPLNRFSSCRT